LGATSCTKLDFVSCGKVGGSFLPYLRYIDPFVIWEKKKVLLPVSAPNWIKKIPISCRGWEKERMNSGKRAVI
jgi:hypothetical protein